MKKSENSNISPIYLKLKNLVKVKKLTYIELADLIGFSRPTVANWFKGTSKIDVDTIVTIAQKLNVPVNFFFENNEGNIPEAISDKEQLLKDLIQEKNARIALLEEKIKLLELIGKKMPVQMDGNAECADAAG